MMIREIQSKKLFNREDCENHIGRAFRIKVSNYLPPDSSDKEVCDYILQ